MKLAENSAHWKCQLGVARTESAPMEIPAPNPEARYILCMREEVEKSRAYVAALEAKVASLEQQNRHLLCAIASANETIEDVCTGAGLTCPNCNKKRPCLCQDA